jgi:hypothetical protein
MVRLGASSLGVWNHVRIYGIHSGFNRRAQRAPTQRDLCQPVLDRACHDLDGCLLAQDDRGRNLSSISQAGLVNNLNDGLAWGLFPLFFAAANMSLERTAALAATTRPLGVSCNLERARFRTRLDASG